MTTSRFAKLVVLIAVAAAGGASPGLHAASASEFFGAAGARESAGAAAARQEGGQETAPPKEPEAPSPVMGGQGGEDPQRARLTDAPIIFTDIMDFTGSANDLFVWSWLPTISGEVSDNGFFAGQKVEIAAAANIGGDAFLFAQTGLISGHVGGDLYAFVADLTIAEEGRVDGAIHGSSGVLTVNGEVGGPVKYAAGAVAINGTIRGDVELEAGELEVGPDAVIEGELSYESAREATIDPGARIAGDIRHILPQDTPDDAGEADQGGLLGWLSLWGVTWDGLWLFSSFLVGAIALAIGGEVARRPAARLGNQPALGLGFGFVVAVVFPAVAILAMILIVTIPLGLISLALYVAAAYLARLVAAQTVGGWLLGLLRGGREASAYASLAIGLLLFFFVMKIPYVGFLVWMAAIVAGLGGIFLATRAAKADDSGVSPSAVMNA